MPNSTISNFLISRPFRHGIAWSIILALTIYYFNSYYFSTKGVIYAIFTVGYISIIVYFNILYLVPEYLGNKQFVKYSFLLILSAFIIAPIRTITLYTLFIGNTHTQNEVIFTHWAIFIVLIVLGLLSTILKIVFDWFKSQRKFRQLETQTMQSELRFLRSQINPHFLFNTLNSLYALTLKKSDKAPEIVIRLSEIMRYMLYECNDKKVLLSNEVNYIRNYLELEQLRHSENLNLQFVVDGNIQEQEIAPLLFVPFLENAFKHGINSTANSPAYIKVDLHIEEQKLNFTIENNIPNQTSALALNEKKSGGIGLVNVKRRLELLYPRNYRLRINCIDKIYSVNLHLNL